MKNEIEDSSEGLIKVLSRYRALGYISHYCIWHGEIHGFPSEEKALEWGNKQEGFEKEYIKKLPKSSEDFIIFSLIELEERIDNMLEHILSKK